MVTFEKQIRKARGIIVMAGTDPPVETQFIPVPDAFHIPAFVIDYTMQKADYSARGCTDDERRTVLCSIFHEVWHERNGATEAADQETRDDMVIWGNFLIDEIPLRHVVIIDTGQGVKVLAPPIATSEVFFKWKETKLPLILERLRTEFGVKEAAQ